MSDKIPYRNKSPYGWWIASYIERAAWDDEPNQSSKSRCLAYENTILIQAKDRDEAYEKVMEISEYSSDFYNTDGRAGHWIFEGITSLLPIYEEIEDGAEILWEVHKNRTIGKIKSLIKSKNELEVFDDTDPDSDKST